MLNLLIAVMGDSFEKVKADEAPHAMFEQADTIVEYERLLTYRWFRSFSIWDPQDEKKFPRYIVIAEEAETQGEEAADGITGRMRKHLNVSTDTVGKRVDASADTVRKRVDALEEEMKRQHNETKQQHEEDKKRQQEETKRQHEEDKKRQQEETKRQHEEMKQQHKETKQHYEEEAKRQHEEMKQQVEETKRQHEEMKSLLATLLSRTEKK